MEPPVRHAHLPEPVMPRGPPQKLLPRRRQQYRCSPGLTNAMPLPAIQSARTSDARQSGKVRVSPVCFELSPTDVSESGDDVFQLNAGRARALAELLQVLSCGEESAALTFDHLGSSWHERSLRSALAGIAADEREHHALLAGLRASLPQPRPDPSLQPTMRRFFMRLADRDVLVHFVRIVAIDSAVCQVLGALRGRGRPLALDGRPGSVLEHIHRDEARHVAIASRCATPLLKSARGREIAADAREQLTDVLRLRADSLDALSVDPDRLFARLRAIPRAARLSDAR
jgi:hypothetical protein